MTPCRLEVCNFLSYGETPQVLDFTKFRLVCLSGENGAGKSGLLEAVPWALWGEARTSNEDLIRKGAEFARVILEFLQHGLLYKIIRSLSLKGAKHTLDFQVVENPTTNTQKSLTEPSIRETQKKIDSILGITYKTFRYTSFLSQGESDAFMRAKPAERKEALSEILQMSEYQMYVEKSKLKINDLKNDIQLYVYKIDNLINRQKEKDLYRKKLNESQSLLSEVSKQIEKKEKDVQELIEKINAFRNRETELKVKQSKLETLTREKHELENETKEIEKKMREMGSLLEQKDDIKKTYSKFLEKRAKLEKLQADKERFLSLENERDKIKSDYNVKKIGYVKDFQTKEKLKENHHKELGLAEENEKQFFLLEKSASELKTMIDKRKLSMPELERLKQSLNELNDGHARLEQKKQDLQKKMEDLKREGYQIKNLKAEICPLCKTKLTEEHKLNILKEYRQEYDKINSERNTLIDQSEEITKKIFSHKTEINTLEKEKENLSTLETELTKKETQKESLKKEVEKKEALKQKIEDLDSDLKKIEHHLKALENDYKQSLDKIENSIQTLAYDASLHQEEKNQFKLLSVSEERHNKLQGIENLLVEHQEKLRKNKAKIEDLKNQKQEITLQCDILRREIQPKGESEDLLQVLQEEIKKKKSEMGRIEAEISHFRQNIEQLEKESEEIKQLEQKQKTMEKDLREYELLRQAFDKDGIQAFLVRQAVPQLELMANEILSRVTANTTSLKIKTDEFTKSGKLKSRGVLDIDISDASGSIRSYETFSGGERFRVDFALRVGLSKMLASQRNYNVQMLVIDEGFGTQDDRGIEAMIESLEAVQDDFEKTLVISHLDKIKEAFVDRINIEKDARFGSRIVYMS